MGRLGVRMGVWSKSSTARVVVGSLVALLLLVSLVVVQVGGGLGGLQVASAQTGSGPSLDDCGVALRGYRISGPGYIAIEPVDLNADQQAVGMSTKEGVGQRAFLFTPPDSFVDLGTLGGNYSRATSVNDSGTVAGIAHNSSEETRAFLWNDSWSPKMIDLGPANEYSGVFVNNSEEVSGTSDDEAFYWTSTSGMVKIGTSGFHDSVGGPINNDGVFIGSLENHGPDYFEAFRYDIDSTTMTNLGTLSGTRTNALVINGDGDVAGEATNSSDELRVVSWGPSASTPTDLGNDGATYVAVTDIDDDGDIVGWLDDGDDYMPFEYDTTNGFTRHEIHDVSPGAPSGRSWTSSTTQAAFRYGDDGLAGYQVVVVDDEPYEFGSFAWAKDGNGRLRNILPLQDPGDWVRLADVEAGYATGQVGEGSVFGYVIPLHDAEFVELCEDHLGTDTPAGYPMGDPVDSATGAFISVATDLEGGAVAALSLERHYNSLNTGSGLFGAGWVSNLESTLVPEPGVALDDAALKWKMPNGRRTRIESVATGSWGSPRGVDLDVTYTASPVSGASNYSLTMSDGSVWSFGDDGRLAGIEDADGNETTVAWSGTMPTVTDQETGHTLALADSNFDGLVDTATLSDGTTNYNSYTYSYTDGQLTTATDATSRAETYSYTDQGWLEQIADAGSNMVVKNYYDDDGRVEKQDLPSDGTQSPYVEYTYGTYESGTDTYVSQATFSPSGSVYKYHHTDTGEAVFVTDANNNVLGRSYDAWRPEDFEDRRGADTTMVWEDTDSPADGRGDRPRMRVLPDPDTGDLPTVTDPPNQGTQTGAFEYWEYWDEKSGTGAPAGDTRVWKYRNAEGEVTEYAYSGTSRIPVAAKDPTGRITCTLTSNGLVTETLEGASDMVCNGSTTFEVKTVYKYAAEDTALGHTCAARLLCSITVAPGTADEMKTAFEYDAAGRMTRRHEAYGTSAGGGSPGVTTTAYTYDAAGRPVDVFDPIAYLDWFVNTPDAWEGTHYAQSTGYDTAGRVKWTSDATNPYVGTTGYPTVEHQYFPDGQIEWTRTYTDLSTGDYTQTSYTYDAEGDLDTVVEGDGGTDGATTTDYDYGTLGRLEDVTVDPDGTASSGDEIETSFVYDVDGNQVQRITAEGTWATGYDYRGRVICEADPGDAKAYLPDGNLACTDLPSDGIDPTWTVAYTYDDQGRRETETRAPGETEEVETSFTYDDAGRLLTTSTETGVEGNTNTSSLLYDRFDVVEERTYDNAGRLDTIIVPPMDVTAFDWSTGSGKITTQHVYDDAGRLESTTADVGGIAAATAYAYDAHGWMLTETSPEGRASSYTYDPLGQITLVTKPHQDAPSTVSQLRSFDPAGRVLFESDFAVSPTTSTPGVTSTYSANGWLLTVTDPLGTRTDYTYNDRGLRTTRTSTQTAGAAPDCASPPSTTCVVESWAYDSAGQLTSHTQPRDATNDTTITYGYDTAGRPAWTQQPIASGENRCETLTYTNHLTTKVEYWEHASDCSGGPSSPTSIEYDYDALDRRTSVTDTRDSTTDTTDFVYDQASNLIQRTDNHTGLITKWRNSINGQPRELIHDDGARLQYSHDNLGRLDVTSVRYGGQWLALVDHTYDDDGILLREDLNNGTTRYRDYDHYDSGQLKTYQQDLSSSDRIETILTWHEDGNLATECTDTGLDDACTGPTSIVYDDANQILGTGAGCALTGGGVPDANCDTTWAYNGAGVRTAHSNPTDTITYTTNRAAQLTGETITGGNTRAFTYDWAGRLSTIDEDDNSTNDVLDVTHTYNPNGRLANIESETTSATTHQIFRYDGDQNLIQFANDLDDDGTDDSRMDLVWDPTMGVPQIIDGIYDADADGPTAPVNNRANYGMRRINSYGKWYGYDHLGSGIDTTEYPTLPTSYDPYGNPDTLNFVSFGYRGELQIGASYIHLRNRNYDPTTGTFTTQDPLDGINGTPTLANPYHYTDNDPLNKTDPLGLYPEPDDAGLGPSYSRCEAQASVETLGGNPLWGLLGRQSPLFARATLFCSNEMYKVGAHFDVYKFSTDFERGVSPELWTLPDIDRVRGLKLWGYWTGNYKDYAYNMPVELDSILLPNGLEDGLYFVLLEMHFALMDRSVFVGNVDYLVSSGTGIKECAVTPPTLNFAACNIWWVVRKGDSGFEVAR